MSGTTSIVDIFPIVAEETEVEYRADSSVAGETPAREANAHRSQKSVYAIDSYGFYVQHGEEHRTPAASELSPLEILEAEAEGKWWYSAVAKYRSTRGSSSTNGLSVDGFMGKAAREKNGDDTLKTPSKDDCPNDGTSPNQNDSNSSPDPKEAKEERRHEASQRKLGGAACKVSTTSAILRSSIREIRQRVRTQGIRAISTRRLAWPFLSGALDVPNTGLYQRLLATPNVPFEISEVIIRDLPRTFPTHCLFIHPSSYGQAALHRILIAYCTLDPEVGYCQGMGFIVAVLLLHLPEEGAFWTFVQLMRGKDFEMRRLYLPGFPLLQQFFVVLRGLIRSLLPNLARHLEEQAVDVSFFASQWFLTLFAYQIPCSQLVPLWDVFFSEGWKFLFRVTIALLQWDESRLLKMRMEEILIHLKVVHEGKPVDHIIARAFDVPLRSSDLQVELLSSSEGKGDMGADLTSN